MTAHSFTGATDQHKKCALAVDLKIFSFSNRPSKAHKDDRNIVFWLLPIKLSDVIHYPIDIHNQGFKSLTFIIQ